MSDGLRLQCPHCSTVLKVKAATDLDPSRKIKCPKCANLFSIAEGSAEPPQRSVEPVEEPQPAPRRKKKAPPKSADSWEQQEDVFGGVSSEGAAYDDDWGGSGGDQYGDQYGNDPWSGGGNKSGSSRQAPKSSSRNTSSARKAEVPALRNLGVIGWMLFGGLGMLIGIGLSTALGLTEIGILIGLGSLFVGPIVGIGIRYGAGPYTSGVGPGIFAAFVALIAIILGKFGAFSMSSSEFDMGGGEDPEAEVAMEEEETKESLSEPALIDRIASKVQEEWILAGKLTEEQLDAHWDSSDVEYDPTLDYLPEVWEEAGNRWNAMTPDVRAATIRQIQLDWYGDEMDSDMEPISEVDARAWIASNVNEEWLEAGRITTEQIEAYDAEQFDSLAAYEIAYTPEVWQEANNRWTAMTPEQKEALKEEVRAELKQLKEFRETFEAGFGWVWVFFMTILSCFWPLYNPIFLVSSVISAYKLGAHDETARKATA